MKRPIPSHRKLKKIFNLSDLQHAAKKKLPAPLFSYIANACETGQAYCENINSFKKWAFLPRVMVDVSKRTQLSKLLGSRYDAPFGIAPMGIAAMMAYEGDKVLAQAARRGNIPFVLSGTSLIKLEEVFAANESSWFQAYLPGDNEKIMALLERVKKTGYKNLVITVDTNQLSNRDSMLKSGFTTPLKPSINLVWEGLTHLDWTLNTFLKTLYKRGMPHFENSFATRGAPIISKNVQRDFSAKDHLNWDHLQKIREYWQDNLIIKGIISKKDAKICQQIGVDALIISNHGGRQLDYTLSPLAVLQEIRAEVGNNLPLMLDGGIMRGTDVIKTLALGADFVFVGRPFLYAAAVAGVEGVTYAIDLLKHEIHLDMALLGVNKLSELNSFLLRRLEN